MKKLYLLHKIVFFLCIYPNLFNNFEMYFFK